VAPQTVAPARVSEQDIERVAAAVAGRLSAHIPAPAAQGSPDNLAGVDELKDLISGLVQERREGDEHTSAMLDTMQQAMMRLLDRMDSLEQSYASAPPARFAPEPRPAPQPAAPAPAPAADLRPMPAVAAFTPMPAEPRLEVARAAEPAPPRLAPEPSRPAPAQLAPAAAPRSAPAESLGPAGVIPAAAKAAGQSREDFIAAARRAARQAAERQAEAAVAAVEDAVPDPEVHGKSRAEVLGAPSAKSKSLLRSRMLVATLLVTLVGSGLAYTLLRKPAGLPAKIERRLLAPSTEAKERAEAAKKAQSEGQAAEQKAAATPPITPPVESEKRPSPAGAAPSAPAAAPTTAPAPAAKPAAPKRSVPETMVDELSDEQDPAVPAEPHKEAGIVGQVVEAPLPPGLTVQTMEGPLSPEQLVRVQQQKTVASFSNSIGARQGEMPAMPASLQPQATPSAPSATAAPSDAVARVAELPPAAVGPMSLRQAAAKGDPSAEFEVAARFAEGKGVEQDFRQAITWYQRAASRGFAPAQYRLATLYERGLGVKADTARARSWYARAAEQGNLKAMHNLAVLSAGRDQEAPDYATAAQWFTRAAAHGLADSQFNLAVLHESGIGVAKDLGAAYQWFAHRRLPARAGERRDQRPADRGRGLEGAPDAELSTPSAARIAAATPVALPTPLPGHRLFPCPIAIGAMRRAKEWDCGIESG
jgi:localization factor PodJL